MPLTKPLPFDVLGEYVQPEDLYPLIDAINDGIAIVSTPPHMDQVQDVEASNPEEGDVLEWNVGNAAWTTSTRLTDAVRTLTPIAATAFVVVGDGTNQTAAVRAALDAARDSATTKTVWIVGEVLIDPHSFGTADDSVLVLYAGCQLAGLGYESVLKLNDNTMSSDQAWYMLRYQANARVHNIRFDGNGSNQSMSGATNRVLVGTYGKGPYDGGDPITGVVFDTVWVHNFAGVTASSAEAHGIQGGTNEDGTILRNVKVWDIDAGSGVGTGGIPRGTPRSTGWVLENVQVWNCEWNGVSFYGIDGVQAYAVQAWNCGYVGLNVEYSTDINFHNCYSYENEVNLRLLGESDVTAWGLHTRDATLREIDLVQGTISGTTKMGQRLTLYNPDVTPGSGLPHLKTAIATIPNSGKSTPELVHIVSPDVPDWTITQSNTVGGYAQPGLKLSGFGFGATAVLSPLASWGRSAGATAPAYAGGGNLGPNPVTFTANSDYDTFDSLPGLVEDRTYLIRGRVKVLEQKEWLIYFIGTPNTVLMRIPKTAGDVGQWFDFDLIFTAPSDGYLQFSSENYVAGNTLVVDYVIAAEIAMQPGMGES